MNRKLIASVLVAATALSGSCLFAQSDDSAPKPPPGRGPGGQPPPHVLERFDLDGDGQLNADERAAAHTARMERRQDGDRPGARLRERIDTNGDGQVSADERAAAEAHLRAEIPNRPRLMARVDTDRDGQVSDAEWSAARERLIARGGDGKGKGPDGERPRWKQNQQP